MSRLRLSLVTALLCLATPAQALDVVVTQYKADPSGAAFAIALEKGFFKKHGIKVVGFWTDDIGTTNRLIYILAYDSLADREKRWGAFASDPEWLKVRAETEKDGPIVARVINTIMRPTPYSPMQ